MLKGKVAIITGASYGMGQTMAELFAEEGAAVVLTARGQEKLEQVVEGIRAKGGRAVLFDKLVRIFSHGHLQYLHLKAAAHQNGDGPQGRFFPGFIAVEQQNHFFGNFFQ